VVHGPYRWGMTGRRRVIGQHCRVGRTVKAQLTERALRLPGPWRSPCRSAPRRFFHASTSITLDPGYVLWSAPEAQRAYRPLIVLMHGWSYGGTDLFEIAHLLPQEMVVASVRAPFAEAGGYAWFPSRGNPIGNPQPRVANDATEAVLYWLDTLPPASSIGLLGFSQGGAMALQLMRRAPARFDYGVQLAGFVVDDAQPGDEVLALTFGAVGGREGTPGPHVNRSPVARSQREMAARPSAENQDEAPRQTLCTVCY
jgi:phospholipase/carboxylesterase